MPSRNLFLLGLTWLCLGSFVGATQHSLQLSDTSNNIPTLAESYDVITPASSSTITNEESMSKFIVPDSAEITEEEEEEGEEEEYATNSMVSGDESVTSEESTESQKCPCTGTP